MNYIQSTSMMSQVMQPPVSNISRDIVSQNDMDSDSSLSIDELGISEELFSALDTDGDSLVTSNEVASAIESKLSSFEGSVPTKEEFESLISELGLEMPEPPSSPSDRLTADLMSTYDTDGDSLLSSDEVSMLTEEEFAALDTDSDGSISSDELSSAIEQVASSETPPPMQGGAPAGGGGGSASSEEEEYDDADTNQDGIVSYEEKMAALGIDTSSEDSTSTQATTDSESLQSGVKLLMDTIKHNSQKSEEIDLSNFKSIMKMMNAQSNNTDLNTYVQNLGTSTSFNAQNYA